MTNSDTDGHCTTTATGWGGCQLTANTYQVTYAAGGYADSTHHYSVEPPQPQPDISLNDAGSECEAAIRDECRFIDLYQAGLQRAALGLAGLAVSGAELATQVAHALPQLPGAIVDSVLNDAGSCFVTGSIKGCAFTALNVIPIAKGVRVAGTIAKVAGQAVIRSAAKVAAGTVGRLDLDAIAGGARNAASGAGHAVAETYRALRQQHAALNDFGHLDPRALPRGAEAAEDGTTLFRGMRGAADGSPSLEGNPAKALAARAGKDIPVDENGMVRPGTGGMSVNESPTGMPEYRRPPSFGGDAKELNMYCISSCDLGPALRYVPDVDGHGFIEPAWEMPFEEYQGYLQGTVRSWTEVFP